HRKPAADVYVRETVTCFLVKVNQKEPHLGERASVWLRVGRLRANVNMNACEIDPVARGQSDAERFFDLRWRKPEFRRQQPCLKPYVRARNYLRHYANRDVRALACRARHARHLFKLVERIYIDRQ